jgi:hypothetical protein
MLDTRCWLVEISDIVMERSKLMAAVCRAMSAVQVYMRSEVRVATPDPPLFGTTVSRSWVRAWRSDRKSSR